MILMVYKSVPMISLQNTGDTGGKSPKPSNHAGFGPLTDWGQSGDKLGTKWGQFYMMKLFNHLICRHFPFLPAPSAPVWHLAGLPCTLSELSA